ncbi:MAG: tyrosine-type recombinase/integrase [Nanoarchaeota archaeon]|nr:tyrosine-type recombinase/integrase [Nanoarchaeota archaeon]
MGKNFARSNTKRSLPNVFNKKQLVNLFESIEDNHIFMGCLIALFCGLRISEVCELKKQDIDLESEKVYIRQSKGDKDRIVMLPNSLKPVIEKWNRLTPNSEYFISGMYRDKFAKNLLSMKFRGCLEKAGLRIETFKTSLGQQRYAYSFHTLRHTYATYLLEKGVDLYYVQRSLGHVDIHTTQIYAYISNKDLQNKINFAFGRKVNKKELNRMVNDPMQLLKLRFANDEISLEEFTEKVQVLEKMEGVVF